MSKKKEKLLPPEIFETMQQFVVELVPQLIVDRRFILPSAVIFVPNEPNLLRGNGKEELPILTLLVDLPPFMSPQAARRTFAMLGGFYAALRVTPMCVFQICEAWVRQEVVKDPNQPVSPIPVSAYEDKKECICIAGLTLDQQGYYATQPIGRDTDGKFTLEGELQVGDAGRSVILEAFWKTYSVGSDTRVLMEAASAFSERTNSTIQ